MKKQIFLLLYILLSNLSYAQNSKIDYITSGYYQLVYEADIAELEGNDKLAFAKLQEAEKCCPLINQSQFTEMEIYCRLLMQNQQFEKAIAYMDTLANIYGKFPARILIEILKDNTLQKKILKKMPDFFTSKMPDLLNKSETFYYSQQLDSIVNVLYEICADDQKVRQTDPNNNSKSLEKILEEVDNQHKMDSINHSRIFQLINTFGFPNMRLFGYSNSRLESGIHALFMHFSAYEGFSDIILQFVREGKCSPFLYGAIIDRQSRINCFIENGNTCFVYGVYSNTQDDQIIDIEHLDERRTAVGLPTREMDKKRDSFFTPM
jgi:hypothetical protein